MPVSGNEERGVLSPLSTIPFEGLPIKKRRFPFVCPNSLSSQEPNGSTDNRHSSSIRNSSVLNTSLHEISDSSKRKVSEVKKEILEETCSRSVVTIQKNVNFTETKSAEPRITSDGSSMDTLGSKQRVIRVEKTLEEKVAPSSESNFHLASCASFVSNVKLEAREPTFEPKEAVATVLGGQIRIRSHMSDSLGPPPLSLPLSLSVEKRPSQCRSGVVSSLNAEIVRHSDRPKWDLNMTMDAWDESIGEPPLENAVFNGLLGADVGTGKQIVEAGERRVNSLSSSMLQHNSSDSLCLSLGSSSCGSNLKENHSGLPAEMNSSNLFKESSMYGTSMPTRKVDDVARPIVKTEPGDEIVNPKPVGSSGNAPNLLDHSAKYGLLKAKVDAVGLSNSGSSRVESQERCSIGSFDLSNKRHEVSVDLRPVKSEWVSDGYHRTREPAPSKSGGNIVQPQEVVSSSSVGSGIRSEVSMSEDALILIQAAGVSGIKSEINSCLPQETRRSVDQAASEVLFKSVIQEKTNDSDVIKFPCRTYAMLFDTRSDPCDEIVKPNPVDSIGNALNLQDHNAKHVHTEAKQSAAGYLNSRSSQLESVEGCSAGSSSFSNRIPKVIVDRRPIKSEPASDGVQIKAESIPLKSVGKVAQPCEITSSSSFGSGICSDLSVCVDGSKSIQVASVSPIESKIYTGIPLDTCGSEDEIAAETILKSVDYEKTNSSDLTNCTRTDAPIFEAQSSAIDEAPKDYRGPADECGSDDEKVNISNGLLEEDSYGSEYESDCNQTLVAPSVADHENQGKEDVVFEDGEFRNSAVPVGSKFSSEMVEGKNPNNMNCDIENSNDASSVPSDEQDGIVDDGEMKDIHMHEHVDAGKCLKSDHTGDKVASSQVLDQSGWNNSKQGFKTELLSDRVNNNNRGTVVKPANDNIEGTSRAEESDSSLLKVVAPVNGNDGKDTYTGGNQSRIIKLPGASIVTSPCKMRSIRERPLGRDGFADFKGENSHPRWNRDDVCTDGFRKLMRDRNQGLSFRNNGQSYGRGRGRNYDYSESCYDKWNSDRNFAHGNNNRQPDFHRHKRRTTIDDEELECDDDYLVVARKDFVGQGRGGRRPSCDELPSFCNLSRRSSPGIRDAPPARSFVQGLRRIPRNISPNDELPEEKLIRGMTDKNFICSRSQPYEAIDGQFLRGNNRKFSSAQRRGSGFRVRSRSPPTRSRARSPGPWSSPRRTPNGFRELIRPRSPVMYRMERIRSPARTSYHDEVVSQRLSRTCDDFRRSTSPSGRLPPRANRIFNPLEDREMNVDIEYIRVGIDRRNFLDRREVVRLSKVSGGEKFCRNIEDNSRPFRACPSSDSEFIDRGNLREIESERRINNRSVVAPMRMRNVAETEGTSRHRELSWHDDEFNERSCGKRRRF